MGITLIFVMHSWSAIISSLLRNYLNGSDDLAIGKELNVQCIYVTISGQIQNTLCLSFDLFISANFPCLLSF